MPGETGTPNFVLSFRPISMSLPWPNLVNKGEPPMSDRVAFVIDQIRRRFFDALQLTLEVGVDELPNRTGAVQNHEPFGKHLIKFVH
jgi:hypothetical protein